MHTARDRQQRETSCYFRINKQERQLSKERTKRQTKNFIDCGTLQIRRASCGSWSSFKQGLRETALDCSAYLVENLTDQPVLTVDNFRGSRIVPIKDTYFQQRRKRRHCWESAKHKQTRDIDLGKCAHRRSSKLSSDNSNQDCHFDRKSKHRDVRRFRETCSTECHIDSQGTP